MSPNYELINQIKYEGGTTNFEHPLKDAYDLSSNSNSDYDKIILYFMSDGEAIYPKENLNKFKNS